VPDPAKGDVTRLLAAWNAGDPEARPAVVSLVYDELRKLAARYLRHERANLTLQPTALVHEAYFRLAEQHGVHWENRAHFFGVAAQAMRRILVDHARAHLASKRGGGQEAVPLDQVQIGVTERPEEVVALDEALSHLETFDPQQSRVVELRFFAGLTVEETAEVLGISATTVKREWSLARAWLHREIHAGFATRAHRP
jgi:RNA polymerase sigma factor (TIGR02999 family)